MTTHIITALLQGDDEPVVFLQVAAQLPLHLIRVERETDYAPDYRIEGRSGVNLGCGWSTKSPKSGMPYVGILVLHPSGVHISGVAWQASDQGGQWFAQLQHVSEVKFDA